MILCDFDWHTFKDLPKNTLFQWSDDPPNNRWIKIDNTLAYCICDKPTYKGKCFNVEHVGHILDNSKFFIKEIYSPSN